MAISIIGHATAANHATSVSKTYTATAGNKIFVALTAYYSGGGSMSSPVVTDNAGNTYTLDIGPTHSVGNQNNNVAVFSCQVVTGGLLTITGTPGGSGTPFNNIFIAEFSGLATSGALDQVNSNTGTANPVTSGAVTTVINDELLICGFATNDTVNGLTLTVNNSFTQADFNGSASDIACGGLVYRIVSSTGTYTGSVTVNGGTSGNGYASAIATYKSANILLSVTRSDTINNLSDAVTATRSAAQNFGVLPSDSINNYSDHVTTLLKDFALKVILADTLFSLVDGIRVVSTFKLVQKDNLTFSDSLVARLVILGKFADYIQTILDSVSVQESSKSPFSDALSFSDSVAFALAAQTSIQKSDALSLSDSVSVELSGVYNPTTTMERIRRYLGDLQSS